MTPKPATNSRLSRIIRRLVQRQKARTARLSPDRRPRWWQSPTRLPVPAR